MSCGIRYGSHSAMLTPSSSTSSCIGVTFVGYDTHIPPLLGWRVSPTVPPPRALFIPMQKKQCPLFSRRKAFTWALKTQNNYQASFILDIHLRFGVWNPFVVCAVFHLFWWTVLTVLRSFVTGILKLPRLLALCFRKFRLQLQILITIIILVILALYPWRGFCVMLRHVLQFGV